MAEDVKEHERMSDEEVMGREFDLGISFLLLTVFHLLDRDLHHAPCRPRDKCNVPDMASI